MRIYIAGKITGNPDYKKQFSDVEKALVKMGHSVMSPSWLIAYPEFSYSDYISISAAMQIRCEAVFFLPNWLESKGAMEEFDRAYQLNQEIYFGISEVPLVH